MIRELFEKQSAFKFELRRSPASARIAKLRNLKRVIQEHEEEIYKALAADLRKSTFEAAVTEVIFVYGELDHAIANLEGWMQPKSAGRSFTTFFAKSRIKQEPKGVCLILSPWNYPFQLVMSPLISAVAAGNCIFIKPSELSAETGKVICKILSQSFEEHEVACLEGGKELATELLELPFDHIFFTGSTPVGKVVMAAAAKNLTSCTLELGGKSPAVVSGSSNVAQAAERIIWGKLVNAGQTCIAPDYVLIQRDQLDGFLNAAKSAIINMFFVDGALNEGAYCKIINKHHFDRLVSALDQALSNGATMHLGGCKEPEKLTLAPVLITDVALDSILLTEEIFGPILPIITYENFEEALDHINGRPKPLAAYLFSGDNREIDRFISYTSAGGTCVNDVLVHISSPKLPFGGVGQSGMGSSHGYYGFKAFSHERAIMYQSSISFSKMAYPPYEKKGWILNLLKKL